MAQRRVKKGLVLAAIPAVGVYAIGDVVSALLYDGYNYADQASASSARSAHLFDR